VLLTQWRCVVSCQARSRTPCNRISHIDVAESVKDNRFRMSALNGGTNSIDARLTQRIRIRLSIFQCRDVPPTCIRPMRDAWRRHKGRLIAVLELEDRNRSYENHSSSRRASRSARYRIMPSRQRAPVHQRSRSHIPVAGVGETIAQSLGIGPSHFNCVRA